MVHVAHANRQGLGTLLEDLRAPGPGNSLLLSFLRDPVPVQRDASYEWIAGPLWYGGGRSDAGGWDEDDMDILSEDMEAADEVHFVRMVVP